MRKKMLAVVCIILVGTLILAGCGNSSTPKVIGIRMVKPAASANLSFEDENTGFKFYPYADSSGLKGIAFEIKNKSDQVMKVKWDEGSFVDPSGQAISIMHSGIKYIEREKEMKPTTIPSGAKINDHIVPTDYVHFDRAWYETSSSWKISPIIKVENVRNQTISILLPIQIGEQTINYHFEFEVFTTS